MEGKRYLVKSHLPYFRNGNDARDDAATSSSILGGVCCEVPAAAVGALGPCVAYSQVY